MLPVLRVFFIGDVVGDSGVDAIAAALPSIRKKYTVDFCIANGENMHEGKGVNEQQVKRLFKAGVDVVTGGDHSFDKHLIFPYLDKEPRLLRPHNYPSEAPGKGYGIYATSVPEVSIAVLNLRGLSFFNNPIACPFRTADNLLNEVRSQAQLIFVDFHAEATAEKLTLAWYLDGRVTALAGTHTHVQTADERVFPQGTGYITDVGFTGPHDSVIGMDVQTAIDRARLQIPHKYKLAESNFRIQGAVFTLDYNAGRTLRIERINTPVYLKDRASSQAGSSPAHTVLREYGHEILPDEDPSQDSDD